MKAELLIAAVKAQAVAEVLQTITTDADARKAGTKAHLLAFVLGCSPCKTQKDLAARLGLTPARACQMVRTFKRGYRNSR